MSSIEQPGVVDRLVGVIPSSYRREVTRFARQLRDRLPPVMLEHRIDALERHVDRRFLELEKKLDDVLARLAAKAS
jgi:hypothetical protein